MSRRSAWRSSRDAGERLCVWVAAKFRLLGTLRWVPEKGLQSRPLVFRRWLSLAWGWRRTIAKLCRHFWRVEVLLWEFSAPETVWRSGQSGANHSPREIPVNREKYREF